MEDYTKREHDIIFADIKGALERIETQVLKTNGRVTFLEKFMWTSLGVVSVFTLMQFNKIMDLFR